MAETRQGVYGVYFAPGTITFSGISYQALLQSYRLTHTVERREIKNGEGQTVGLLYPDDEKLEATFELIPSNATSEANALVSMGLPAPGTKATAASFHNITVGTFGADSLNNAKWIYEGGGTWNVTNDGAATMTLPLVYYKNITPS